MDAFTENPENVTYILDYLADNLPYLSDIYKCPCESCIKSNTSKINDIITYILTFYKFIITNKKVIKQNKTYFIQIKPLVKNMIKFNNEIIKDNILYFNLQKNISIIYLEDENENENESEDANIDETIIEDTAFEKPYQISTFIKYYPELTHLFNIY